MYVLIQIYQIESKCVKINLEANLNKTIWNVTKTVLSKLLGVFSVIRISFSICAGDSQEQEFDDQFSLIT